MDYLTTIEAANLLTLTPRRVRQLIQAGQLPAEKRGRDWFIRRDDLERIRTPLPHREDVSKVA